MIFREGYLQELIQFKDTDFIKVITGVHRSGKSVLLTQYQDYLQQQGISKERIFYLNFESFEHQWVKTAEDFQQLIQETLPKTTEKIYFLIDKIQFIEGWQKIELLENAFLFYKAKQYDLRGKGYLKTNAKYFIVDNGLRRHAIG